MSVLLLEDALADLGDSYEDSCEDEEKAWGRNSFDASAFNESPKTERTISPLCLLLWSRRYFLKSSCQLS
jgi:hypothetical protein